MVALANITYQGKVEHPNSRKSLPNTFPSSYLLKSCDASWTEGIVALEAGELNDTHTIATTTQCISGSGIGALQQILKKDPDLFLKRPPDNDRPPRLLSTASGVYSCIQ